VRIDYTRAAPSAIAKTVTPQTYKGSRYSNALPVVEEVPLPVGDATPDNVAPEEPEEEGVALPLAGEIPHGTGPAEAKPPTPKLEVPNDWVVV